jgi:transcriptional regulator with XRE-family HTH domain
MARLDPHAVAIGTAVRAAITEAGYSVVSFAKVAGIPKNTMSRRVTGLVPINYPELVQISELTGVSLSELVARAERISTRAPGEPAAVTDEVTEVNGDAA